MHYCDVQCQTMDWELHKTECKKFSTLIGENNMKMLKDEMTRMFLRILIKLWVTVSVLLISIRKFHDFPFKINSFSKAK
jgi:hypothetical protein